MLTGWALALLVCFVLGLAGQGLLARIPFSLILGGAITLLCMRLGLP